MRITLVILFILLYASCEPHNKFNHRVFDIPKGTLLTAIDSLHNKHPHYRPPDKWRIYDGYSQRGYEFSSQRRFYFPQPNEEMYYVSILAYNNKTRVVISAVHTNTGWHLEEDMPPDEITRIEKRFEDRIISKLEAVTNSRCTIED